MNNSVAKIKDLLGLAQTYRKRFKAYIQVKNDKIVCLLEDVESGRCYYVDPPTKDVHGKKLPVGSKCWVTLGKNKKFYYTKIIPLKKLSKKQMKSISDQVDKLFNSK